MNRLSNIAIGFLGFVLVQTSAFVCAQEKLTYDDHVKPIFMQRCARCHSAQKKSSDLDLSNYTNLMLGGSSGDSIEPGDASNSFLYQLVTHEESPEMPPGGTKIPDKEISLIEKWINGGALENKGSKARIRKSTVAAVAGAIATRPEVVAIPPRLPTESIGKTANSGAVVAMATSPWAPIVAISAPRQILLYQTQTKRLLGILPFPEGQASVLRFSRTGQLLIAGGGRHGAGGKVVVWDVALGDRITEVGAEIDNVLAADISSDHRLIALGGPQRMLRVYSTADGSLVYEVKKHTDWITSIAFSPDGVLLASGDRSGGLHVWEADSGNEYLTLGGHTKIVADISWRSDANALASVSGDATAKVWEAENGRQIKSWTAHPGGVTSVEFTRDNQVASSGRDNVAKLWQQDGKLIRQFEKMSDVPLSISFCNESKRLLCGDVSGTVKCWNAADGKSLGQFGFNVPSLAERLENAIRKIADGELRLRPLMEKLAEVTKARDSKTAAIDSIVEDQQTLATNKTERESKKEALEEAISQSGIQRSEWQTELGNKTNAKPALAELHQKAVDTLALLPNDPELQATAAQMETKVANVNARIAELGSLIEANEKESREMLGQIKFLAHAITGLQEEQQKLAVGLANRRKELEPIEIEFGELNEKISQLKNEVKASREMVEYCNGELAFIQQLGDLKSELDTAEQIVDQRAAALDVAKAELAAAQKVADEKAGAKKSAEESAVEIQRKIKELKQRK